MRFGKYLLLAILFAPAAHAQQWVARRIIYGSTLPAVCNSTAGEVFIRSGGAGLTGLFRCSTTNVWVPLLQGPLAGGTAGIIPRWSTSGYTLEDSIVAADATGASIGTSTATAGTLRFAHGATIQGRDNAGAANRTLLDWGTIADELMVGSLANTTRIRTGLAAPINTQDGDWWVQCTGASPARICVLNVRDGGAARAIATVVY